MNLILFSPRELTGPLPREDQRAKHILEVLKLRPGQRFDAGLINGPRGKATLLAVEAEALTLSWTWEDSLPALLPVNLWVSFCRPQTCRRILQECTSLGVAGITFFDTEKCELSYRDSRLWTSGEAQRLLVRGAEQAFSTRIPELRLESTLEHTLKEFKAGGTCLALDNYEATLRLGETEDPALPVTLAVGGERGWSATERNALRSTGFLLAGLGSRVLRTDTACIAAVSIVASTIGGQGMFP